MEKQDATSVEKSIDMEVLDGWTDVKPEYWHYKGNTIHRDHKGQGDNLVYKNSSGRNDIVLAKIARDNNYIYFYVETADDLSPKTDPKWMRLFIDSDRNNMTGWEGYDFIINRFNPGDSSKVEKSQKEWDWEEIGSAAYVVQGNVMQLMVKRSILGLQNKEDFEFDFKWSDNMQQDGNIMDFYVNGDVAPGGRFNFVYRTDNATGLSEKGELPVHFSLLQNYPNPFNSTTTIKYDLSEAGPVQLSVYDISGRKIVVLVDIVQSAGTHDILWSAENFSSGIYWLSLKTSSSSQHRKMLLVK